MNKKALKFQEPVEWVIFSFRIYHEYSFLLLDWHGMHLQINS